MSFIGQKEADETYIDTLNFILEKWTIKEAIHF
jgi:hypothetical protein